MEKSYLVQVVKKLLELEAAATKGKFNPSLLTKTTSESETTLEKYKKQHTFIDDEKQEHLTKWHMRFIRSSC